MAGNGTIQISATIIAGPPQVSDSTFPTGSTNIPVKLNGGSSLASPVQTGDTVREVNSPSAYVALGGVGTGQEVTQGRFLFLRCSVPMLVRLTFYTSGGDVVSVLPLDSPLIMQIDSSKYLKGIEAQGAGTVEWFVGGSL